MRQSEAKKALSVAICDHYNHVRKSVSDERTVTTQYSKQNLLLLGPTGVGKDISCTERGSSYWSAIH